MIRRPSPLASARALAPLLLTLAAALELACATSSGGALVEPAHIAPLAEDSAAYHEASEGAPSPRVSEEEWPDDVSVAPHDVAAPPPYATVTASGLAYHVLRLGSGQVHPTRSSEVTVHYAGWTTDGMLFDSSLTRGRTATFPLDRLIAGWIEGIPLMVVGERARFWVPEALAYGGQHAPYGVLVFDIELLAITP